MDTNGRFAHTSSTVQNYTHKYHSHLPEARNKDNSLGLVFVCLSLAVELDAGAVACDVAAGVHLVAVLLSTLDLLVLVSV